MLLMMASSDSTFTSTARWPCCLHRPKRTVFRESWHQQAPGGPARVHWLAGSWWGAGSISSAPQNYSHGSWMWWHLTQALPSAVVSYSQLLACPTGWSGWPNAARGQWGWRPIIYLCSSSILCLCALPPLMWVRLPLHKFWSTKLYCYSYSTDQQWRPFWLALSMVTSGSMWKHHSQSPYSQLLYPASLVSPGCRRSLKQCLLPLDRLRGTDWGMHAGFSLDIVQALCTIPWYKAKWLGIHKWCEENNIELNCPVGSIQQVLEREQMSIPS